MGVLLASGLAPSLAAAQERAAEQELRAFAEGLQNGTLPVTLASQQCRREMAEDPDADDFGAVMAGYLEVPEELALAAFCDAFIRAIRAGDVTTDGAALLAREEMDAGFLFEMGRLLRAVYFSHRLTTTASAAGEARP